MSPQDRKTCEILHVKTNTSKGSKELIILDFREQEVFWDLIQVFTFTIYRLKPDYHYYTAGRQAINLPLPFWGLDHFLFNENMK